MKVLTFGEIMLRLKAPGHERFFQSPMLEATFGGGEANVAISLANYGMDAEFLTVLPKNDIAECCIRELRYFGVDTKKIVRSEGRMGIYYLEGGANQLPSKVVYDRAYSSIALAKLFLNKFTKLHEIQVEAIVVFCSAQDNAKLLCPRTGLDVARLFRLRLGGVSRLCACHQRCREQNQHQHHCNYFFHCFSSVLFL